MNESYDFYESILIRSIASAVIPKAVNDNKHIQWDAENKTLYNQNNIQIIPDMRTIIVIDGLPSFSSIATHIYFIYSITIIFHVNNNMKLSTK